METFGHVFNERIRWELYSMMVVYILYDFGIDGVIPIVWWYTYLMNVLVYDIWCLIMFGKVSNKCRRWELYIMMMVCRWYDIGIEDDIPVVGIWYLVFDNVFNDVQRCELFIMMEIYLLYD